MPAQNRVTPFGEIISCPEKGLLMGNRGALRVDAHGQLVGLSRWNTQNWLYCSIDKKFEPKEGDRPLKYTRLFFADEYTALAAGHRPCGYCLRKRFDEFISAWLRGNPQYDFQNDIPKQIDRVIHKERTSRMGGKELSRVCLASLPGGVMITLPGGSPDYFLWREKKLFKWSPAGYVDSMSFECDTKVEVLTPKSVVNAIRAGFFPGVEDHP